MVWQPKKISRSMELDHRFDHISSGGQVFFDMMEGKSVLGLLSVGV
ncbi:MAG: hypothetical protein ACOX2O_07165 [Bdellovibrionota bacterium]